MAESKDQQARRALEQAEICFRIDDVARARGWAQYALSLSPGLHGAAQASAAYDVLAARGPLGTRDSYAVLGLPHPCSGAVITHDAVRRQHRRLCLLVHPDKNTSAAADGAFKLVQAAYDELSVIHPPMMPAVPPPPATNATGRHPLWDEEQEQPGHSQPAGSTMRGATGKQPPIARPPPRVTDPHKTPQRPSQPGWHTCPIYLNGKTLCEICSATRVYNALAANGSQRQ